ncbi:hypothetical protein B0H11DRAFT_1883112 [Mycena galericulata]|nr:hypothetical protein B0H11DRAFT_1883112 [Mycena galericulata]
MDFCVSHFSSLVASLEFLTPTSPSPSPYGSVIGIPSVALLSRELWKNDQETNYCEICSARFTLFKRRHHCRRCGGIFCHECSSRTAPLLEKASTHSTLFTMFKSRASRVSIVRVCDDCCNKGVDLISHRFSESDTLYPLVYTLKLHAVYAARRRITPVRSFGALDAYPLKVSSAVCKATGGGMWTPRPYIPDPAGRVPMIGGKAPFDIEIEEEEAEEQSNRENPVIRHGEFQYRFPTNYLPEPLGRRPIYFSTF